MSLCTSACICMKKTVLHYAKTNCNFCVQIKQGTIKIMNRPRLKYISVLYWCSLEELHFVSCRLWEWWSALFPGHSHFPVRRHHLCCIRYTNGNRDDNTSDHTPSTAIRVTKIERLIHKGKLSQIDILQYSPRDRWVTRCVAFDTNVCLFREAHKRSHGL